MSTDVLEPVGLTPEQRHQLARIDSAQWLELNYDSHALVAQDDSEALIVLTARFLGMEEHLGLWVVDADDKCFKGLENAKRASVRDLKAGLGLPQ